MRWLTVALLAMGGCQCFEPVAEVPSDGGRGDAGVDAGVDAGPECLTAADCRPPDEAVTCEFGGPAPARSCVDERCVFDCRPARTCRIPPGSQTLFCGGTGPGCLGCPDLNRVTGRVARRCGRTWEPLGDFAVRYAQGAVCNFVVSVDGGGFGTINASACDEEASATVNEEGKVTCTVRSIPTGLSRLELGCARCMYLLEWP